MYNDHTDARVREARNNKLKRAFDARITAIASIDAEMARVRIDRTGSRPVVRMDGKFVKAEVIECAVDDRNRIVHELADLTAKLAQCPGAWRSIGRSGDISRALKDRLFGEAKSLLAAKGEEF